MTFDTIWKLANAVYDRHEAGMDNKLKNAAETILGHTRDRYELTLREGQAPFTVNEIAGIIALALDLDRPGSEEPFKARSS